MLNNICSFMKFESIRCYIQTRKWQIYIHNYISNDIATVKPSKLYYNPIAQFKMEIGSKNVLKL